MTETSDYKIELWETDKLIPYEKNAKIHDDENVRKIMESIRQYGWNSPIQIKTDGTIVCGHGRRLAAIKLGIKVVPVRVLDHIKTDAEIDAYRLVDNQVAIGKQDADLLAGELRRLSLDLNYDMSTFFSKEDLKFALEDVGEINMDQISADLSAEVDQFAERTQKKMEAEKGKNIPVAEALGFKDVSVSQNRIIARLGTLLRAQYPDLKAKEAFLAMITDYMEQTA